MTLDYWRNADKDLTLSYEDGMYFFKAEEYIFEVNIKDLINLRNSIDCLLYK